MAAVLTLKSMRKNQKGNGLSKPPMIELAKNLNLSSIAMGRVFTINLKELWPRSQVFTIWTWQFVLYQRCCHMWFWTKSLYFHCHRFALTPIGLGCKTITLLICALWLPFINCWQGMKYAMTQEPSRSPKMRVREFARKMFGLILQLWRNLKELH